MRKETVAPSQLLGFFAASQDWEADRMSRIERSEKRAWFVAGCSGLITAIAVTAVVSLMPLKRVVPYVYSIDRQTGELMVMDAANQDHAARQMAIDTPAEYARLDKVCGGRMLKTLRP